MHGQGHDHVQALRIVRYTVSHLGVDGIFLTLQGSGVLPLGSLAQDEQSSGDTLRSMLERSRREDYHVPKQSIETVYGNMPVFGLAAATAHEPLRPGRHTAAARMGVRAGGDSPVETY